MNPKLPRREFLARTSAACVGGCLLLTGKGLNALSLQDEVPIALFAVVPLRRDTRPASSVMI